ncbi:MAG: A/G-specific adenine glycosylase [Rhodospirillales bacterium]|jgi:A/G-specific adenine glycosylase|nr:A/G-specific adenine glycosylase [Rhodospirillales bacterium]
MKQFRAATLDSAQPGDAASSPAALARRLLVWYDRNRRDLPWRARPGERPNPYHVWLSEIMLQQTTVATVEPYFRAFIARWPTIDDLARADLQAVLHAWQGLGYYARARNLHKCAGLIAGDHGGRFPESEVALRALPGIGTYTAAAISAIAFDRPAAPVDGNVERVLIRLFALAGERLNAKREVAVLAKGLIPAARPGDFWQAVMDLGAAVCRPRSPICPACPWAKDCLAVRSGLADDLPRRGRRKTRPLRHGVAFWAADTNGAVLLRRRPERGLLGGMTEVPGTEWRDHRWTEDEARALAPAPGRWQPLPGRVHHVFTHFELELIVLAAIDLAPGIAEGLWCRPADFHAHALPTVMRKVADHAIRTLDQTTHAS